MRATKIRSAEDELDALLRFAEALDAETVTAQDAQQFLLHVARIKEARRRDRELADVASTAAGTLLAPAIQRVMLAVCQGSTTREIASDFGRSPNTIRNQIQQVFGVMGVRTRSELVAKCARLGIIPTLLD